MIFQFATESGWTPGPKYAYLLSRSTQKSKLTTYVRLVSRLKKGLAVPSLFIPYVLIEWRLNTRTILILHFKLECVLGDQKDSNYARYSSDTEMSKK